MDLGQKGVFWFTDTLTSTQLVELAQHTEELGYAALWYPEALGYESFSLGSFLLSHTDKLIVASGIANIYARDATATKQGQHSLTKLYDGRFLLGLGVSHVPLVENARGHQYRQPVATMRAYLDTMDKATAIAPPLDEPPPTVLAALGPQMIALAGQRTDGAFPYNVIPEHTARARAIIGLDKWLCVEQKVLLVTDPSKAREVARQAMAFYLPLTNYRNNWNAWVLATRIWQVTAVTGFWMPWSPGETKPQSDNAYRHISTPGPVTSASIPSTRMDSRYRTSMRSRRSRARAANGASSTGGQSEIIAAIVEPPRREAMIPPAVG
jgi:probable F420-dependent oxidoreductase